MAEAKIKIGTKVDKTKIDKSKIGKGAKPKVIEEGVEGQYRYDDYRICPYCGYNNYLRLDSNLWLYYTCDGCYNVFQA